MTIYPTGFPDIDALPIAVSRNAGDVSTQSKLQTGDQVERLREVILLLAVESCDTDDQFKPGVVVSIPTAGIVGTQVVAVSPNVLDITHYADRTAYQAALNTTDFIHAEDLGSAIAHVTHGITAPYKLRLKRGDNGQYQRVLLRGIGLVYKGVSYRITIMRREVP